MSNLTARTIDVLFLVPFLGINLADIIIFSGLVVAVAAFCFFLAVDAGCAGCADGGIAFGGVVGSSGRNVATVVISQDSRHNFD